MGLKLFGKYGKIQLLKRRDPKFKTKLLGDTEIYKSPRTGRVFYRDWKNGFKWDLRNRKNYNYETWKRRYTRSY